MLNQRLVRIFLSFFSLVIVGYPLLVRLSSIEWSQGSLSGEIFPLFGLLAASLLWLHIIGGAFEPWLRKYINFEKFIRITAGIIFVSIILHPLFLLVDFGFKVTNVFSAYGSVFVWTAVVAWLLLITYDIGKALQYKYDFFSIHWRKILFISNVGFIITFYHAINIGRDLQSGPLKYIWAFYGTTAILGVIYTYVLPVFLNREKNNL